MAETQGRMKCPDCRIEMNHHSDKLVYATDLPQAGAIDTSLGGFIEEFHTCPKCGAGASRRQLNAIVRGEQESQSSRKR